jgi:transcriptional regulator with XRE-family HTH domain
MAESSNGIQGSLKGPRHGFGSLLRHFRERAGRSGNSLAHEVQLDPSFLWRLEKGEREPPAAEVVKRIAAALRLSLFEENRLLFSAGLAPVSLEQLGDWDAALQDVVDVLTDARLNPAQRAAFRDVLHTMARHWGRVERDGTSSEGAGFASLRVVPSTTPDDAAGRPS